MKERPGGSCKTRLHTDLCRFVIIEEVTSPEAGRAIVATVAGGVLTPLGSARSRCEPWAIA